MNNESEANWWKSEPEEEEVEWVMPVIHHGRPSIARPLEEQVEDCARELREGTCEFSRKNVEFYMTIRNDHAKARDFLHMLLDAHYDGSLYPGVVETELSLPPDTAEEIASAYAMPNEALEGMFGFDKMVMAVELLRARGQ